MCHFQNKRFTYMYGSYSIANRDVRKSLDPDSDVCIAILDGIYYPRCQARECNWHHLQVTVMPPCTSMLAQKRNIGVRGRGTKGSIIALHTRPVLLKDMFEVPSCSRNLSNRGWKYIRLISFTKASNTLSPIYIISCEWSSKLAIIWISNNNHNKTKKFIVPSEIVNCSQLFLPYKLI